MAIVLTDLMGISANIMSNVAFLPQIIRSFRRKQVEDLSIGMFAILFLTNIFWIGYALPIQAIHLCASAFIEIGLLSAIFGLWFRYRSTKPDKKQQLR